MVRFKFLLLISMFTIGFNSSFSAQNSIVSSGGTVFNNSGNISYSIGQVFYTSETGVDGEYLEQGVQHPFEINVETTIPEASDISLKVWVYPNPVTDYLILRIEGYENHNLRLQFYNIKGEILKTFFSKAVKTNIETNFMAKGIYLLKVIDKDKEIKTFKIIKR